MTTQKRNIRFLSKEDIDLIINHLPDDLRGRRDRAIMQVAFSTGLRISELLRLKRSDFTKGDTSKVLEISIIGKMDWQRTIYISPTALQATLRYFAGRSDDDDRAFMISKRGAQKMVKVRAIEAGMEKFISCHVFRHSFACHLLKQGVSLFYIQQFCGHRAISSTSAYLHATNFDLEEIHKKIMK